MWGATAAVLDHGAEDGISIHAPRVGSDQARGRGCPGSGHFNPRSPCGERREEEIRAAQSQEFQSTLPVWGATTSSNSFLLPRLFQSTLPVWGATKALMLKRQIDSNFNPRSPCGERPKQKHQHNQLLKISIHAPRVGSDLHDRDTNPTGEPFQSTLPVWGATGLALEYGVVLDISIHAPRVGSDDSRREIHTKFGDFNPRSPCGERRTARPGSPPGPRNFNPRSPCGERPARPTGRRSPPSNFNPRSPCGERLLVPSAALGVIAISIHAPRVGSDPVHVFRGGLIGISIHAPRVGSDSISLTNCTARGDFNPRSPCGERRTQGDASTRRRSGFQSTLPVWGATPMSGEVDRAALISIHAPRVGSD